MERKSGRIASIDILRCIAIIGMVMSGNIGFYSDLPAWMFHAQTPPPTYAFSPEVAGITWVDLVFPFFIFSLGAALPFAMRRKLEGGMSRWEMTGNLIKRWFILTAFALVLGNAYMLLSAQAPVWQISLFLIFIWVAMFLALVRINRGTAVNLCGVAMLLLAGILSVKWFGITLDKGVSDIIIMILAVIAISGGLIWMLTIDSIRLRWLVFLLIAAFKALDSFAPQALSFVPSCNCISWFFGWDWLQYLLIVIPASIVGDLILRHTNSGEILNMDKKDVAAGFIAFAAMLVQLWGLFTRNIIADFIISAVLAACFIGLTWKRKNVYTQTAWIGFGLMLAGIIFDPIDGGIAKDYCNTSYLLTTGGMAALVTTFLLMLEIRFGVKAKFLSGVGQNPMLAYTVAIFIVWPLFSLTGFMSVIDGLAQGSPFWGVAKGVIITLLMMCVTYLFTRLKLFWRS